MYGAPAGLFQRYLVAGHPQWAAALRDTGQPGAETAVRIDYLIGKPELTGRGLGTAAITAFTRLALARYPAVETALAGGVDRPGGRGGAGYGGGGGAG